MPFLRTDGTPLAVSAIVAHPWDAGVTPSLRGRQRGVRDARETGVDPGNNVVVSTPHVDAAGDRRAACVDKSSGREAHRNAVPPAGAAAGLDAVESRGSAARSEHDRDWRPR